MKVMLALLSFAPTMAFAGDITLCGQFKDNGDSFQILDGKLNPYVDGGEQGPRDPNGIQAQIFTDNPWGKNYCVTGTVQAFDRQGEIAFEFVALTSATRY